MKYIHFSCSIEGKKDWNSWKKLIFEMQFSIKQYTLNYFIQWCEQVLNKYNRPSLMKQHLILS